jgi:hypothetical protein
VNPSPWIVRAGVLACAVMAAGVAQARCPDPDTLVVGDTCKQYGEDGASKWSAGEIPLVATLGLRSLSYAPSMGGTFDGNVETSPLAYSFPGQSLGSTSLRTYGMEAGLAWYPIPFAYVGLSLAFGMGQWSGAGFSSNNLGISSRGSLDASMINYAALAGLRLPLGTMSLRGEMLLGGSSISIDQYAQNGNNQLTATASSTVLLLEPRVALDVWATPTLTVSLFGSMPSFDPDAANAGIILSMHLRAFDGMGMI